MNFDVEKNLIYRIRAGSHSYGCNIEGSDEDYKGIAVAPIDAYLGTFHNFEQREKSVNKGNEFDEVIYDVKKFITLASNNNPNCIEVLFVEPKDILFCSPIGEELLNFRNEFLSKGVYKSFSGYAFSQFKRIKTHKKYLLNPPKIKPERTDFCLSEISKITPSEMGAYDVILSSKDEKLPDNIMELLSREKKYAAAKREWDQFQDWKNNRNPARAVLEAEHSYDCKNAYHIVRLFRMGLEILEGKGVVVNRPDREELIAIRQGAWKYEQLEEWFEQHQTKLEKAYVNSALPDFVDKNKLSQLCVKLISDFHSISFKSKNPL